MPGSDAQFAVIEERLRKLHVRQEALVTTCGDIVAHLETQMQTLGEIIKWLQQPPSNDLGELLSLLAARVGDQAEAVIGLQGEVGKLIVAVGQLGG